MAYNLTRKLLKAHLVEGTLETGKPIGLRFDQTLCQDATGTLVMLALEAMELEQVNTQVSAQYVDHNLLQEDHRNPDDHLFLLSAAKKFGLWYSRPGNGISHPLHMQRFCKPGMTLIGSDSHTCAAGSMAMFAIGAGGADVAMAMAGEPVYLRMPAVWGIELTGELPPWVSAKDVILELLRRYSVTGGLNRVLEYYGPGVSSLSAMDRHVIANMGAELGATASVFPSDSHTAEFLAEQGRRNDYRQLSADPDCDYDHHTAINLSQLEPLIAMPSSPDNVVPVRDVAGEPIYQAYIGSSANPGFRDYAVVAEMVAGRTLPENVSLYINPSTRQVLQLLSQSGHLDKLLSAGARLHQAGCNGCIGMGQAPATQKNSLRTTPRNFPGRSGTREDRVWLCSPETAAASALHGRITDPRTLSMAYPRIKPAAKVWTDIRWMLAPEDKPRGAELVKGPNIAALPAFEPVPERMDTPVALKLGDNVSTDTILPAGAEVLPYRSNIPKIAQYVFCHHDDSYSSRVVSMTNGHTVVAGENYGQGSSREHAALAPRYLGLQMVIAKSIARIHHQNLINFGIVPLTFERPSDYDLLAGNAQITIPDLPAQIRKGNRITAKVDTRGSTRGQVQRFTLHLRHSLPKRQQDILLAGGVIPWLKQKQEAACQSRQAS